MRVQLGGICICLLSDQFFELEYEIAGMNFFWHRKTCRAGSARFGAGLLAENWAMAE